MYILIIFDGFFDLFGSLRKQFFFMIIKTGRGLLNIDTKIKNREIVFASLLCFFTIKTQLNRHHIVSLIIISICLVMIFLIRNIISE